MNLKQHIRTIPNFPKEGIMFKDITTLLANPDAFNYCIDQFVRYCEDKKITAVAGIESRGFIFGSVLASKLGVPFHLVRKPGKLPAEVVTQSYELEYGTDELQMHKDALQEDDNVLIIDDLLATGGTMEATCKLIEKIGARVAACTVVIELSFIPGREKLKGYEIMSLVSYD